MNIETLKIFCDVARLRSFSRSAEVHEVTQSAASQAVHHLEERLGVSLIDRRHRPWTLTPEGKIFYDGCRDVVDRYERLERQVARRADKARSEVRVASIYSVGLRHMREFIQKFSKSHPHIQVHLDYRHPDRVAEAVWEERADVGIVSFPESRKDMEILPWRREEMVLACASDHPLAREREIDPKRLDGEPFVAFEKGLAIRREVDRFLRRQRITVSVDLEFDNIEAIKQAVEIGSGVSLLPAPTFEREVKAGSLAMVPLAGKPFYRHLGIVLKRGRDEGSPVDEFVQALQADARVGQTPALAGQR